jgi:hypothetical protein
MSNILALPLVQISVITGTNEDWVDSLLFLVSAEGDPDEQLDLTGITFDMEVRRLPDDNQVTIRASTKDGTLKIGEPPNHGFLIINISHEQMKIIEPGNYIGDIIGSDEIAIRRCVLVDLEIVEGLTRP